MSPVSLPIVLDIRYVTRINHEVFLLVAGAKFGERTFHMSWTNTVKYILVRVVHCISLQYGAVHCSTE